MTEENNMPDTPQPESQYAQAPAPNTGGKSKVVYGILAILLGGLGLHKFYLGNIKQGVIYLILGFLGIGFILGLITGVLALLKSDEEFYQKYVVEKAFI